MTLIVSNFIINTFLKIQVALRFANQTDGLWGIEIDNYVPLTTIVVEYLDTTKCCIDPPYVDDKYYDNYQYQTGWSYKNYTAILLFQDYLLNLQDIYF